MTSKSEQKRLAALLAPDDGEAAELHAFLAWARGNLTAGQFANIEDALDNEGASVSFAIWRGARAGMGPWQGAIDDALIAHGLDCTGPDSDPIECLSRLLRVSEDMALDPAISVRAEALIARGRAEVLADPTRWPAEWKAARQALASDIAARLAAKGSEGGLD